jgi:hypothetical protein
MYLRHDDGSEFGIRHIAVVGGVLFAAKMERLARDGVEPSRRLDYCSPSFDLGNLSVNFRLWRTFETSVTARQNAQKRIGSTHQSRP